MTPLTTLIFDFHAYDSDSDSVAIENRPLHKKYCNHYYHYHYCNYYKYYPLKTIVQLFIMKNSA